MKIQDYQKGKDPRHTISRITKAYRGEEEWILHAVGDEDKKTVSLSVDGNFMTWFAKFAKQMA